LYGRGSICASKSPACTVWAFGEIDADELSLDLGANDVGVVRDHCPDAAKINRHVMLGDDPGHDRTRGRWSRCGSGPLQWVSMREVQESAAAMTIAAGRRR